MSMNFDYIFIGGGTTGLPTAARLAELSPTLSILVLEAGKNVSSDPNTRIPGCSTFVYILIGRRSPKHSVLPQELGKPGSRLGLLQYTPKPCWEQSSVSSSVRDSVYITCLSDITSEFRQWQVPRWHEQCVYPVMDNPSTTDSRR